ncbi:hypothetical protein AAXE64_27615 [Priestia megaterium]
MDKISFEQTSFLEKKAAFNPKKLLALPFMRKGVKEAKPLTSSFTHQVKDSKVDPSSLNLFNEEQVIAKHNDVLKGEGTGSFLLDGALGLTKRIVPKTKDAIEKGVVGTKNFLENADTKAGTFLAGKNPDSMRGKAFSTKVNRQIGEEVAEDGTVSKVNKEIFRPSAVAVVEKPIKFATPLLATGYVADKLYPREGQKENETTTQENMQKESSVHDNHTFLQKDEMEQMDKVASMQKIAELEESLEKHAKDYEILYMEKTAAEQKLEQAIIEKDLMEKTAAERQEQLFEKQAEFEELRLRTIAQKRSKIAVDLAEEMLENGLIKQAEVKGLIDELMICDESTIKRYENMNKMAGIQEESLESLAIIGEYKDNKKLASTHTNANANLGLSKRGQSIGEAASDLNRR